MAYYVYITASGRHGTLYLGVTNNLSRRIWEHKTKVYTGFSAKYGVDRLVWYETYEQIDEAIAREKALKKSRRGLEDPAHRGDEPRVAGFVPRPESIVVVGSGLRCAAPE